MCAEIIISCVLPGFLFVIVVVDMSRRRYWSDEYTVVHLFVYKNVTKTAAIFYCRFRSRSRCRREILTSHTFDTTIVLGVLLPYIIKCYDAFFFKTIDAFWFSYCYTLENSVYFVQMTVKYFDMFDIISKPALFFMNSWQHRNSNMFNPCKEGKWMCTFT